MQGAVAGWMLFRVLRWVAWIWFFGFVVYYFYDPSRHHDSFRQLLVSSELVMFTTAVFATFFGFFELAFREKARLLRPNFLEPIPPRVGDPGTERRR